MLCRCIQHIRTNATSRRCSDGCKKSTNFPSHCWLDANEKCRRRMSRENTLQVYVAKYMLNVKHFPLLFIWVKKFMKFSQNCNELIFSRSWLTWTSWVAREFYKWQSYVFFLLKFSLTSRDEEKKNENLKSINVLMARAFLRWAEEEEISLT